MLTAFIWTIVVFHLIGGLGSIEIMRSPASRTSWQIGGLVFHVVVLIWGGLLLWLMRGE